MKDARPSKARFFRDLARIDPKGREAWLNLLRAHRVATSQISSALVAKHHITLEELELLVHLGSSDEPKRMSDLAKEVYLSSSGMTRMVDRLQRRGLVSQRAGTADRREARAEITASGLDLLAAASRTHTDALEQNFIRLLSRDELKVLAASLGKVAQGPPSEPP